MNCSTDYGYGSCKYKEENDAEGLNVPAESLPSKKTGFRAYFVYQL